MKALVYNQYSKEGRRWALSALLAALVLTFAAIKCSISFFDNDDLNIAWALAGYRSGTPSFSHPFVNCITGALVSGLYTLFPQIPWWFVCQWAALWGSMTVIYASLLKIGFRRNAPIAVPLVACGLLTMGVFIYPVVAVTFTLSSALLGAAACGLLIAMDPGDEGKRSARYLAFSVVLLGASLLMRQSAGLCVACFYGGVLCYRLLLAKRNGAGEGKGLVVILAASLAVLAVLSGVNAWGRANLNPEGFMEFENARAEYMDYPHDAYGDNPSLYETAGWDAALASLADRWFYMDERINGATLSAITEGSTTADRTLGRRLTEGLNAFRDSFLKKYIHARLLLLFTGVLLLGLLLGSLSTRRYLPLAAGAALTLGAGALLLYLCTAGRMNLRTLQTLLFPLAACLSLLTMETYSRRRLSDILLGLCAILALLPAQRTFREMLHVNVEQAVALSRQVTDYALAHPENVYIRDVYAANNYDALCVYPHKKPTNLMDWGGCDMYTAARTAQLEKNGLPGPYADVFLLKNVYYICERDGDCLPPLADYMASVWGAMEYELTDTVADDIVVVSFHG